MALKKKLTTKSNYDAEYHRVTAVFYNRLSNVTEIQVGVYKDKASAIAGADPIAIEAVKIEGEANEIAIAAVHDAVAPIVYGALKQTPQLAGASNV